MKVFCSPIGTFSTAMVRIANALKRYAPAYVQFVDNEADADVSVMYVIGFDYMDRASRLLAQGKKYIALQCCLKSTSNTVESEWCWLWRNAELTWSYYDLREHAASAGFNFYYSPLGVDDVFKQELGVKTPRNFVITSGYVHGSGQEALAEVWDAARAVGLRTIHIGPPDIQGTDQRADEHCQPGDNELAVLYRRARWCVSLRHLEGFELPAAEALSMGAGAIVFDQSSLHHWYRDLALFVPECSGEMLVGHLHRIFTRADYRRLVDDEWAIDEARDRFNWQTICTEFWRRLEVVKQADVKETAYAD